MQARILLFGPQGSGKGTQGEKLADWLNLPLIVTGNIFRQNMKEQTEVGKLAQQYINHGELVPDHVTNRMIAERLSQADCDNGFILDGFPRNQVQVEALDTFTHITHLLHITISDEEASMRITHRRQCQQAGHIYHDKFNPPTKAANTCDIDGSPLVQREDDTAAALKTRLDIYHAETEPILEHYRKLGVVYDIDGSPAIDKVWETIQAIFTSQAK